uniref:TCTA protein n=1 Tax=Nothoprocta perdicaria TaxID=30464 RepID=A0A8C7EFR6_NOTPE
MPAVTRAAQARAGAASGHPAPLFDTREIPAGAPSRRTWRGQARAPWRALGALGRELAAEWAAQDLRAALCQLLLLWLGLSLLGIRLAWRAYGGAVAALCYRAGTGGRGPSTEPAKTHRE